MELQSIRLRGFKGVRHGLGVDQIELDLSGLSGLIALTGRNGAGKTTVLEQLQPFPQVVSRPAPALKNHVYLRDSEKELCFRLGGHDYRSLVKIDSQSGRAEGYLWRDGAPAVKGKITDFTTAITGLFGTPDLFFQSVFCAQGSAKISDLRPAEFKRLMAEFLRLDRYFQWEKDAKEAEGRMLRAIDRIDRQIEKADEARAALGDPERQLEALKYSLLQDGDERAKAEAKIAETRRLIDEARAAQSANERHRSELLDWQARLSELNARITNQRQKNQQAIGHAETAMNLAKSGWWELSRKLDGAEAVEQAAGRLGIERAALGELEKDRDAALRGLRAADSVIEDIRTVRGREIADLEGALESLRADYDEHAAAVNRLDREVDRIASARGALVAGSQISRLEAEINALQRQAADLEKRGTVTINEPVGGVCGRSYRCNSEDCAFIRSALDAAEALPGKIAERDAEATRIQAESEKLRAEQKDNDEALTAAKAVLATNIEAGRKAKAELQAAKEKMEAEVASAQDRRRGIQQDADNLAAKIQRKRTIIADLEATAARVESIRIAREQLPGAEAALKQAEERFQAVKDECQAAMVELNRSMTDAQAKVDEINGKIDFFVEVRLNDLEATLRHFETALEAATESAANHRAAIARAEADVARAADLQREIEALQGQRDKRVHDATVWAFLKNATGANGLRALEIDATAPLISQYSNDLVSAADGPPHTLELRTQDDEGREVLLPVVTRPDGSSEIIGQFSGGEKTWDLKALRLALTLVAKQKSRRDFRTAYADEEDGALDLDAARAFIRMYREFLRLGGFDSIFYISHKPECVGMADHQIVFNGGVHVE